MKRLSFLLFACFAFILSVSAQTSISPKHGVEWDGSPEWNKFDDPHVVAIGSSYDYAVELHFTKTLAQIMANKGEKNSNRYVWELFKVDTKKVGGKLQYYNAVKESDFRGTFDAAEKHFQNFEWKNKKTGDFYLIRVKEYANHDLDSNISSKAADFATESISEILVKIGDDFKIFITDDPNDKFMGSDNVEYIVNADSYLCSSENPTVDKFDERFGSTKLKFNGRPLSDGTFEIFFSINFTEVPNINRAAPFSMKLKGDYDVKTGYYTTEVTLAQLQEKMRDAGYGDLTVGAASQDIYYEVKVLGYLHADMHPTADEKYTALDATALKSGEKASRTYGSYYTPKITKINHK